MNKIELETQCPSCKGTGLYVGMGEQDGFAIQCSKCKGTGCYVFKYEYQQFIGRQSIEDVDRVLLCNPGICVGVSEEYTLSDYGGMPFSDWLACKPFPDKSEMRKFTCPSWWYQTAGTEPKPDWDECWESLGTTFSKCPHFGTKEKCWDRWDKENQDAQPIKE